MEVSVQKIDVAAPAGAGLGFSIEPNDAQYTFETEFNVIPASKRVYYVDPDHVTTGEKDSLTVVTGMMNCFGPTRTPSDIGPRNASRAGSYYPQIATVGDTSYFALGSSTAVEPWSPQVPLAASEHSVWGVNRVENDGTSDLIGYIGANFTGLRGVWVRKLSTGDLLRYYYTDTLYLESPASILNKWTYWLCTFSVAEGRKLYVDGALVASEPTATDTATAFLYQLFSSGTGSASAYGKAGVQGAVNVDLSTAPYDDLRAAMAARYAAQYPLGT